MKIKLIKFFSYSLIGWGQIRGGGTIVPVENVSAK